MTLFFLFHQAIQAPQELQEVSEETRLAGADDKAENANDGTNSTADNTTPPHIEESEDVEMQEAENEVNDSADKSAEANNENSAESPPTPSPKRANVPSSNLVSADEYHRINLAVRFNADAIKFISQIQTAIPFICLLLASKSKVEVVESMDFFVTAWNYKIEASAVSRCLVSL